MDTLIWTIVILFSLPIGLVLVFFLTLSSGCGQKSKGVLFEILA